jgi:integrase
MRDLMRHSDIATTMDVYGHTLTPELRKSNSLVARQLFVCVRLNTQLTQ